MTTRHNDLLRVFWPSDISASSRPGILVGWRNSELDFIVISLLQDAPLRNVENALQLGTLLRSPPHPLNQILERCGNLEFEVIGTYNSHIQSEDRAGNRSHLQATSTRRKQPPIISHPDPNVIVQTIYFDRPDPERMQYLSITPISLTLDETVEKSRSPGHADLGKMSSKDESLERQQLVEKLKLHTVIRHPKTKKELALPAIINQINCSRELDNLMQQNIGLIGARSRRALSVGERVAETASNVWSHILSESHRIFRSYIWPIIVQILILFLMLNRTCGEMLLNILELRLLSDKSAALKDLSATAQQLDIRLQQFCYWPVQYLTLRRRRGNWGSLTNNHPEYIRFYNSLWLVANDVIIGIAVGSYIIDNADLVASQLNTIVDSSLVDGLQRMITWLMDWPAGLKLNNELAAFLGDLFLWVIEYWAGCMQALQPLLPHIVRVIGFSSFAGASLPVAVFSDLVSLLTVHIYAFYIASARIYSWQLTIIVSLFHLFRGKKRNVLRNRIDSCDYDLDQLLIGTILFTLLTFLLPTVGVFYSTFASARMGIIAFKAILDSVLACLNHFPLFALMLRIKDSKRLPGGIRFELQDVSLRSSQARAESPQHQSRAASVVLKSICLPLSLTFSQYSQLGDRILKHYCSSRVLVNLLTGRIIPPISRRSLYSLQYSMLPIKRVGVMDLWRMLSTADSSVRSSRKQSGHLNGYGSSQRESMYTRSGNGSGRRTKSVARKRDGMWWSK